jgi:hypothetical protein
MTTLSTHQQKQALTLVAEWMGRKYFDGSPCPTGQAAAHRALGPMLVPDWEGCWSHQEPNPAILVEGIPGADWANWAAAELREEFIKLGISAEPATGFALNLHPF